MIDGQISLDELLAPGIPIKGLLFDDLAHKNGEIYIDNKNPWIDHQGWPSDHAWPKEMKNGEVIYHEYHNGDKPQKDSVDGRKRRFLFKLMLNTGNPTWGSVKEFLEWLNTFEKANKEDEIKAVICGKYCKNCKNKTRESDIGGDAMELATMGYKE